MPKILLEYYYIITNYYYIYSITKNLNRIFHYK